jgi:hypothetical protein
VSLFSREHRLRFAAPSGSLREVAEELHEHIRANVLKRVANGDPVVFVSCGVATPPGPTQLILEDRRRGAPGYAFRAFFERVGPDLEITVRVSRMRSVPLELLDPLLVAAKAVAKTEGLSWASET